jgi:hypothetical protein
MAEPTRMPLTAIRFDRAAYPRLGLDPERIAVLRDLYAADGEQALPPIDVVLLDDDLALGADGAHRCEAAQLLGWTDISVRVIPVPTGYDPIEIAYLHALETAVAAAKPLTRSERKAAAARLLSAHPDWSDREIARRAGVSHTTVGAMRDDEVIDSVANASDAFVSGVAAERAAISLVRGLAKAWEARGITDLFLGRMPATLASSLEHQFGDEAPTWAARLERWANEARRALSARGQ